MTDKVQFVDFGVPERFGAHIFRVEIPAGRTSRSAPSKWIYSVYPCSRSADDPTRHPLFPQGCTRSHRAAPSGPEAICRGILRSPMDGLWGTDFFDTEGWNRVV